MLSIENVRRYCVNWIKKRLQTKRDARYGFDQEKKTKKQQHLACVTHSFSNQTPAKTDKANMK